MLNNTSIFENEETLFDVTHLDDGGLMIRIRHNDFCGSFVYYIEEPNIIEYVESLKELDENEVGNLRISDMDSDSYIKFEKMRYGHMMISGQLGSSFKENYLFFKFPADQTIITNLINRLIE